MDDEKKTKKPRKRKAPVEVKLEIDRPALTELVEEAIEALPAPTPEKESKGSTAKKVKDLGAYAGEVALFELSRQVKKGPLSTKFVVVARIKPRSGLKNTSVWISDEEGVVTISEPLKDYVSENMTDALSQLGFKLV